MTIHEQITDILAAADCHQVYADYAGVGARATPRDVFNLMTEIAIHLDLWGWTLRSGGAEGADEAFDHAISRAEVFLPWPGFAERGKRGHPLPAGPNVRIHDRPTVKAARIASMHHPNWAALTQSVQRLMARNTHQILGADCMSPCSMVICWTPDGSTGVTTARTGGTGQALRIAYAHGIPIFNLQRPDHRAAWEAICAE